MTSFFAITLSVLPLVGAIIAWLGDVIGYRLGRSRRTIFGLRPRTTARLIGVAVGALLPLIGLAVAAVGSEQVRTALLHMDELRSQTEQLAQHNDRLNASRQKLLGRVKDLEQREEEARDRVAAADRRAQTADDRSRHAEAHLAGVNQRLNASQARLKQAHERLKTLEAQRDKLQTSVDELTTERERLTEGLEDARRRAAEIDRQRREVLSQLQQTQEQLKDLNDQRAALGAEAERLRADRDRLTVELDRLTQQSEDLNTRIAEYRRLLAEAQTDLEKQQTELRRAKQQVADANAYLDKLRQQYAARITTERLIEESPVIYEPGDEVVRATVTTRQKREQIEAALSEILVVANSRAVRSRVPPDETGRALRLVRPLPAQASLTGEPGEKEIIAGIADRMLESAETGFVVTVRSLERHFLLEPRQLNVEMRMTPDKVRFHEGEVVDSLRFDPPTERADVLRRVFAARGHLREVAMARGLLPDSKTGEYGGFPAEGVMAAIDKVAQAKRPVEVLVVAARDVRTSDPLIVSLEVRPVRE